MGVDICLTAACRSAGADSAPDLGTYVAETASELPLERCRNPGRNAYPSIELASC